MGSQIIQENFESVNEQNVEAVTEKTKVEVMNILKQNIRPEFLNRIDEIIMFKPLMKNEIRGIIQIQLNGLCELLKSQGVQLEFSPFALDYLSEQGYDPQYGARPLKRVIQKEIVNLLSKKIIAGEIDKEKKVVMDVFDGLVVLRNE
jgi:ATP-dependent Clp protease ATP-binding subunit ClpB